MNGKLSAPSEKATPREWLALAVIALPCMVYAMDLTVLNLAIPTLTAALKPTASQMLWIIDLYGFMVAGFLITMGTLGDKWGRRRVLLLGAGAFAAASALAALATSANQLIALRGLLGLAGATLAPSTLSLISNMFRDENERRFAIGVWISSYSLGGIVGPLVGGVLLEYFGWPAVFLAAVPVMLLLLMVGPWLLPEYKDPQAGKVDLLSVALSLIAVLGVVFAVKRLAEGRADLVSLVAVVAGVAAGMAFASRQSRIPYPLMDLSLFTQRQFRAALCTYGLTSFAMFGVYIMISQYLQIALGLTPWKAGLYTVPWSVAFVVGSLGTPAMVRRASAYRVLTGGLAVAAIGFLMLLGVGGDQGLAWTVGGMIVMGLGMAPVLTLGNEVVISSAPPERAGAASALSETSAELSGALGIALFGSLGTALYRAFLATEQSGPFTPAQFDALSTLAGALSVAGTLPGAQAAAFSAQAISAFVFSLQVVTLVGAGSVLLALTLTVWLLRGRAGA